MDTKRQDDQADLIAVLKDIHRALQELGFNNAITRMPGAPTLGIGERLVLALEEIAARLPEREEE
jgi:hypothetical protein